MTSLVDIVGSRVKSEILRLLFGLTSPDLHLRELVRQSGLSLATVQQELRRLTRVGIVLARKDGNRVYYRANPAHLTYPDLHSLVLKTDGLAGVLRAALSDPGIQLAFVFGSVARGDACAASDVDLMVIGGTGLRKLATLLSGTAERIGREINPHLFTVEEFTRRKLKRDHLVSSVLGAPKLFIKGTEDELKAMVE
jgi:DNA-binding transcriptional ArsR family regulator